MRGLGALGRMRTTLLVALVTGASGCWASVGVPVEDDYYYDAPPPAFIATAPVYYYDGRPTYWYGGRWHYHDGGRWRHYRQEPDRLRDFRSRMGRPAAPMNRGLPMNRGMPMQRGRGAPMAPAPGPASGAPTGRGRASPRVWEGGGRSRR